MKKNLCRRGKLKVKSMGSHSLRCSSRRLPQRRQYSCGICTVDVQKR
uniref:50S ribosomal protein L18 n=1 Tax=Echinococcus granulosus TaxID=6210 RepID=A0A068X1W8_ECHGR|nr:hypothetical protein EgrG_000041350 [Echinococcus granulosus]